MVTNPSRFLALLCHALRTREKTVISLRHPARQRLSRDPSHADRATSLYPSWATGALACHLVFSATAATLVPRPPPPRPKAPCDCLPLELLFEIFADFSLEELLPLRLVSKRWRAAADSQAAYSRDIDYWADYEVQENLHVERLKARLACSSRNVRLRVAAGSVQDHVVEEILALISQHLHRTEHLWIRVRSHMAPLLFDALRQPAPLLRDLAMDLGVTTEVDPDIFVGNAPILHRLSMHDCAIDSPARYPAFSHVRRLKIYAMSEDSVGLGRMFKLCPELESLEVGANFILRSFPPRDLDVATVPRLDTVRLDDLPREGTSYLVDALTGPFTTFVCLRTLYEESTVAMFSQLRGRGPFIFTVDNDQSTELHTMHIRLSSLSSAYARAIDVYENEHWEWDYGEPELLEYFWASALASQIVAVHVTLQPEGYSALALLTHIYGEWEAVHTVRIDLHSTRTFTLRLSSAFPNLQQVVLYHPELPPDASPSDMRDICSKFLEFFRYCTGTLRVVLTRDSGTADLLTLDPGAASNNPLCIILEWQWVKNDVD